MTTCATSRQNATMNGLVKEGWEFAGMTSDKIVMRRPLGR